MVTFLFSALRTVANAFTFAAFNLSKTIRASLGGGEGITHVPIDINCLALTTYSAWILLRASVLLRPSLDPPTDASLSF